MNSVFGLDGPYRILIVDDRPDNLRLLSDTFTKNGYHVRPVISGVQALDAVETELPDLILLDICMPVMDGFEVCRRLKTNEQTRDIPIIFVSALADANEKIKAFECGGVDYVTKPFQSGELLVRAQTQISLRNMQKEMYRLNLELEERVQDRTQELEFANLSLRNEINERIQAEKDLNKSEARFRRLIEGLKDDYITFSISSDSVALYVSPSVRSFFGIAQERFIGRNWKEFVPLLPESLEKFKNIETRLLQGEDQPEFEFSYPHPDGTIHTLEMRARPVADENGNISRIEGIGKDITERKRAEQERILLSTAVENVEEMVVITDKNGTVQYVNPAFIKITGYEQEDVIGKTSEFLKTEEEDDKFHQNLWHSISRGQIWKGRSLRKAKEGRPYKADATIYPIKDENGSIANYVIVNRDITQEIKVEAKLRQAQRMEAIGTLTGGIAHDFNNILSPIGCYAEMCLEEISHDQQVRPYLEEILQATNRARDLIKQILAFGRAEDKEPKPTQLNRIAKEILKFIRSSVPSTIEIRQKLDSESYVFGDPVELHQIVMNLCTNSYQAMQNSGGCMQVTVLDKDVLASDSDHRLPPGAYVELRVQDTGHGMSADIMEKIFDPYFTTRPRGEGTGLGLANVRRIVNELQGRINVESEPGKGTEITISLPRLKHREISEVIKGSEPLPRGREHILVVDDEPTLCTLVHTMLEGLGYQVNSYTSSLDALERFKESPFDFDLIITDLTMPKLTGIDFAYSVRVIRPDVQIIMMSGYSEIVDPDQKKEIGIRHFLKKPLIRKEVAAVIRQVLSLG